MLLNVKDWNEERRALLEKLKRALAERARLGQEGGIAAIIAELAEFTKRPRSYLARRFDHDVRRAGAEFHYSWMTERFAASALHAALNGPVEIWAEEFDGLRCSVGIFVERYLGREGELTIELYLNETALYALGFTCLPGSLFGLDARAVFLVSRIQGWPERFEEIKAVTKAMSDVSPRASLFAALAGIARAVGVDLVLGVSADNYVNFEPDKREALERLYDAVYQTLEATGPENGIFVVDLNAPPKPVNAVKAGHRIRTRRKREIKRRIAEAVTQSWPQRFPPG